MSNIDDNFEIVNTRKVTLEPIWPALYSSNLMEREPIVHFRKRYKYFIGTVDSYMSVSCPVGMYCWYLTDDNAYIDLFYLIGRYFEI
jgi:hypothetical protein